MCSFLQKHKGIEVRNIKEKTCEQNSDRDLAKTNTPWQKVIASIETR